MDERRKYVEGKLQCNVDVDSAAHSRQQAPCFYTSRRWCSSIRRRRSQRVCGLSFWVQSFGTQQADTEQAKIDAHLE